MAWPILIYLPSHIKKWNLRQFQKTQHDDYKLEYHIKRIDRFSWVALVGGQKNILKLKKKWHTHFSNNKILLD